MTEKQEDEVLSFNLEDLPDTISKLQAIEKKCRDVGGEVHASKQGVNQVRVTCTWEEHGLLEGAGSAPTEETAPAAEEKGSEASGGGSEPA